MTAQELINFLETLQPNAKVQIMAWHEGQPEIVEIEGVMAAPEPVLECYLDD